MTRPAGISAYDWETCLAIAAIALREPRLDYQHHTTAEQLAEARAEARHTTPSFRPPTPHRSSPHKRRHYLDAATFIDRLAARRQPSTTSQ
jgi:hypothetical protein